MPERQGHQITKAKYLLAASLVILLFEFSPISNFLLRSVDGSFSPSPYSSLSLANQVEMDLGVRVGKPIALRLTNHTLRSRTYIWTSSQDGKLISQGTKKLGDGQEALFSVSSKGSRAGRLRISLMHTNIFVTVVLRKSGR